MHSLFKEEFNELNIAKKIYESSKNEGSVSTEHFIRIILSYERNLKSMMKITKISDYQQLYLQEVGEKLQKEIDERKKVEEKLSYYAYRDPMTGVSNRRIGLLTLEEEVGNCLKENSCFSVCYIDIDGLKNVNDIYGHTEGDYFINTIVEIIKEIIKEIRLVSRMGGDEFIIVFPGCSYQEAKEIIDIISKRVEEFNAKDLKPYKLSFSYGIEEITKNIKITDIDEIIKIADELMYKNKMSKKLK